MRLTVFAVSIALGFAVGYSVRKGEEVREARLFVIERSTNANLVAYDARLKSDGFDTRSPISVYWILNEDGGRREELSTLERRLAYGVEISRASAEEVVFALVSLAGRPITVRLESGEPVAIVDIDGERSRLERVFVQTRESGILPSVEWVELRGLRLRDGRRSTERILP